VAALLCGEAHPRYAVTNKEAKRFRVGNHPLLTEATMSYFPGMQKGNLDSVKADEHGKIKKETVALKGVSVTRVTFDVGAKWSTDLKDYAGTNSCELPHVALVLFGTLRVVMDDGSQQDL